MHSYVSNIETIELDSRTILKRHPDIEREKANAVKELLELGKIKLLKDTILTPPYHLTLSIANRRLVIHVRDYTKAHECQLSFSLKPYRRLIKDYFLICESYQSCVYQNDNMRLQTIDMARRGIHNEGAEVLKDRLDEDLAIDFETARALFTLICILHLGAYKPW